MEELTSLESELAPEFMSGQAEEPTEEDAPETETVEEEQSTEETEEEDGQGEESDEEETLTMSAKEYKELRKFATQKAMEAAEYKKLMAAKAEPEQAPAAPQTNLEQYIAREVEKGLQSALEPLQQQQTDLRIQATVQTLAEKYTDFNEVAPAFIEELEENPELFDMENGLELAYKSARAGYLASVSEAKTKIAVANAQKTVATKIANTETAPATKQQQASDGKAEADAIMQSILDAGGRSSIFD